MSRTALEVLAIEQMRQALDLQNKLAALQAVVGLLSQENWTACSDGLPDTPGPYLGWDGERFKISWLEYKFGSELGWGETCRCTHWMPLPLPPEKHKENL
jgi:hypothetical protein